MTNHTLLPPNHRFAVFAKPVFLLAAGCFLMGLLAVGGGVYLVITSGKTASLQVTDSSPDQVPLESPGLVETIDAHPAGLAISAETASSSATPLESSPLRISLNSANKEELETIPAITPEIADQILASRPFKTIEELVEKQILDDQTLQQIRPFLQL